MRQTEWRVKRPNGWSSPTRENASGAGRAAATREPQGSAATKAAATGSRLARAVEGAGTPRGVQQSIGADIPPEPRAS